MGFLIDSPPIVCSFLVTIVVGNDVEISMLNSLANHLCTCIAWDACIPLDFQ